MLALRYPVRIDPTHTQKHTHKSQNHNVYSAMHELIWWKT